MGLSVDTRQVYIGNGGDDAPKIENIELLTSLSDVVSLANTYTYSDSQIGFSAQTGSDPAFPVKRALQDKLDDFASVRDFGAKGDNTTDDTDAINRALYELFAVEQQPQVRRSLYFPAGVYKVSSEIKIPSYAVLTGEGPESTIISSSATTGTVAVTADSLQQVSVSIGSNGATQPSYIVCNSMSFTAEQDIDTFTIDQANTVVFNDCVFTGNKSILPTGIDNSKSCVTISSSPAYISKHIVFKSCVFKNHTFGFNLNNDIHSVLIDGCRFDTLFKGMKCGETITGSSPSVKGPSSVKITSSVFDKIYNKGIHVFNSGFGRAVNYFLDVGNSGAGVGNATADV
ncbi:MAG: hypothetical protein H8D23_36810, partial [Candidatus Brocadiales bacterium]|nr:hypothetical protein [Candidatus Brocadiales bacterium]